MLTKPLKGRISTDTGWTLKTSAGSIHRKNDIAQATIGQNEVILQQDKTRGKKSGNTKEAAENQLPENFEEIGSDEELPRAVKLVDFVNPADLFQQSQSIINSKLCHQEGKTKHTEP